MSREPKRMEENVRGSSRIIVYIAVTAVIMVVLISYIIIANMIENKQEAERLAELEKQEKQIAEQEATVLEVQNTENHEELESVSSQIGKTVEEKEQENKKVEETASSISTAKQNESASIKNEDAKTTSENKNKETSSSKKETKEEPKKEITFSMPIDGEIVRGFAKDSLVYSETLQEWIVHQAIDIKANSRDVVKAAEEGTVMAIKSDPRYGLTVIIEHDGGFKTVYSNLLTAEFVVEGEKVKKGQTLGTVGSSATFEIADEPHLHFEMLKDSIYVDPTIYIK